MHRYLSGAILVAALAVAGCTGSGVDQAADQARTSLELAAEAASLEAETGELVGALSGDPSEKERQALRGRLSELDAEAAELISSAEADSTYTVKLEPVNRSGASGTVTLLESDGGLSIEGSVQGAAGGGRAASINGLPNAKGASICPPADAASGADKQLSGSEAEDFYGPAMIEFGSSGSSVSGTQPVGPADPITSRAMVISARKGGDEAPIACGIPIAGGNDSTSTEQIVAGVSETRGALSELSQATKDLASQRAKSAQRRADRRLTRANRQLRQAVRLTVTELDDGGELSAEDQAAVDDAIAQINGSKKSRQRALAKLKNLIAAQIAAKAERQRQRQEAIAAAQEPSAPDSTYSAPAPAPPSGPAPPSVVIE